MRLPASFPSLDAPPAQMGDASVYVHFPYCGYKCPYCDFNVRVGKHSDNHYTEAVLSELQNRAHHLHAPQGLNSIYFGGGTPSRWAPDGVRRIIEALDEYFGLKSGAEITLEVNPEDGSPERLQAYAAAGINRFSIGCQSFQNGELQTLGRQHSVEANFRAIEAAKQTTAHVSIDLIYGLPDQDREEVLSSIHQATQFEPDHISAYTLTIEPRTVFARRTRLGTFVPMPDDTQASLFKDVSLELNTRGYKQYEVSSYARDGRVAIHNNLYWLGGFYLGLGAGAHSYLPQKNPKTAFRRENERRAPQYIRQAMAGDVSANFEENLSPRDFIAERAMVIFRSAYGLNLVKWRTEYGPLLRWDVFRTTLNTLQNQGLVSLHGHCLRPTLQGFLFNDAIARTMLSTIEDVFID